MSYGTQLDFFEPLLDINEFKSILKSCAEQLAEMQELFLIQHNTLGELYLALRSDNDQLSGRLTQLEQALKK